MSTTNGSCDVDPRSLEALIDNEKEWRRYMVEQFEKMRDQISHLRTWSIVFRLAGAGLFALLLALIEMKG